MRGRLPLLTVFFALALAATGGALAGGLDDIQALTGDMDRLRQASGQMPLAEEREIGRGMAERLMGASPPVHDARVQRYVNRVGLWVAEGSQRPHLAWTFGVLDTPAVNAFAAPGGYVFITRGLFLLLNDEGELAVVLGHEIAHVTARHHLQALAQDARVGITADLVGNAIHGHLDHGQLEQMWRAGARLYAIGLKRRDEFDADRIGVALAARAGYDPWTFMDTLTTLEAVHPDAPAMALQSKTHPSPEERRARLLGQLDQDFGKGEPGARPETRFDEMRDRLSARGR